MGISSWPLQEFSQLFLVLHLGLGIRLALPDASKDTKGGSEPGENGFTGVRLWLNTARDEAEGPELPPGFGLFFFFSLLLSPPGLTAKLLHRHRGSKQDKKAAPGIFGWVF